MWTLARSCLGTLSRYNIPGRKEGKHRVLRPQKPLRLIRDGEVEGSGIFISNTCSLHCHCQNDFALRWAAVWAILMFHELLGAKSQDSVHKPQFLKRKESRSGSNQGPSAYQPSALPLGHTGSPLEGPQKSFLTPSQACRSHQGDQKSEEGLLDTVYRVERNPQKRCRALSCWVNLQVQQVQPRLAVSSGPLEL